MGKLSIAVCLCFALAVSGYAVPDPGHHVAPEAAWVEQPAPVWVEQPAPVYHAPAPAPVWVEQQPAGPSHKELKALKKQAKAAKHAAKKAAPQVVWVEQPVHVPAPAPEPVWVEQPAPVWDDPAPVPAGPSHKEL